MNRLADYPDHPDEVVISPRENFVNGPAITEIDVYNYYGGVSSKMIEELKGRNLFIAIKPRGEVRKGAKPIYIRHPYDKETEFIRIGNDREFETYRSGRTVEYHVTMPQASPYYIIDFDAGDEPFEQTKKITAEIADRIGKLSEVKEVEIRFTGKRGFHVLGWLKKARDVNEARNFLKGWLRENFGNRTDVVVAESPRGTKGALGLSPMKINGGQVAKWSLRISGLCCVEVPRAQLMSFQKEDASIEKVYKKATGATFTFGKQESQKTAVYPATIQTAIDRVVRAYTIQHIGQRVVTAYLRRIHAGYDNEVFKPGYKGKFLIQEHLADKAGPHWDVRFQWPVTSVSRSLHTYKHKGRGTEEPSGGDQDDSGSVYRSFVDKKMELPKGTKKIFLVKTEDHPIEYEFEGEITSGYGKGHVKIFDKGQYELLDKSKERMLLRIKSRHITGTYALVPYEGNYLWIKVD